LVGALGKATLTFALALGLALGATWVLGAAGVLDFFAGMRTSKK
jgi:hypothetical protein